MGAVLAGKVDGALSRAGAGNSSGMQRWLALARFTVRKFSHGSDLGSSSGQTVGEGNGDRRSLRTDRASRGALLHLTTDTEVGAHDAVRNYAARP